MTYDPTTTDAMRDRVRIGLQRHPEGIAASTLAAFAQVDSHELAAILAEMREAGDVAKDRHMWRLVTP